MSTYSIASRLIWKKGFNNRIRPDLLLSSCGFDLKSSGAVIFTDDCNARLSVILNSSQTNHFRPYSSAKPPSESGNGGSGGDEDKKNDHLKHDSNSNDLKSQDADVTQPVPASTKLALTENIVLAQNQPVFGTKENRGQGDLERPFFEPSKEQDEIKVEIEEELVTPTNCCRSGCPNCVWIEYVEKLTAKFTDPKLSRAMILKELDTMDDQSIKAFIMMELRSKGLL